MMKRAVLLNIALILSVSCLYLVSCRENKSREADFIGEIYRPVVSEGFLISGNDNDENSLVTVYNPWQGAEEVASKLMIARDGNVPEIFDGEVLKDEAKRIVCMSSTHIAMLDSLGVVDRIVGVSGMQYISNPYIRSREKEIPDVGYEGHIDYETLASINPDLVLLFSINGPSGMEQKLRELGIPFMYVGDYVEESPLGKAEWIMPIAEVVGKRDEGLRLFENISGRYNKMKERVSGVTERPKVMLNMPFGDSWFMPSTDSFVAKMMTDAGAEYIYKKNTGNSSMPIDLEEAYRLVSEADLWLNIGAVGSREELALLLPKFMDNPCVKEGKLYNNNRRQSPGGGNDCYESGVMNPDLILRDLIKIFHPRLVEEDFVYYRQL